MHMDLDAFNVWVINPEYDSTKTVAVPYQGFFPYLDVEIHAFNYTYPITLRWDTALFRLPWLPAPGFPYDGGTMDSGFFFSVNNSPFDHLFILGWADSVVVEPFHPNMFGFPILVNLGRGSTVGMDELRGKNPLQPFPNPGSDEVTIWDAQPIMEVQLRSLDGRLWNAQQGQGNQMVLNVPELPNGMYVLRVLRADGTWQQATWAKVY